MFVFSDFIANSFGTRMIVSSGVGSTLIPTRLHSSRQDASFTRYNSVYSVSLILYVPTTCNQLGYTMGKATTGAVPRRLLSDCVELLHEDLALVLVSFETCQSSSTTCSSTTFSMRGSTMRALLEPLKSCSRSSCCFSQLILKTTQLCGFIKNIF